MGNRKGRGGGWDVGVVGLVVYQVGNTEANELPGLSGLASRQCTVAHIHYDCSHHTDSPPPFRSASSSAFPPHSSFWNNTPSSRLSSSLVWPPHSHLLPWISVPLKHTCHLSVSFCTRSISLSCRGADRQVLPEIQIEIPFKKWSSASFATFSFSSSPLLIVPPFSPRPQPPIILIPNPLASIRQWWELTQRAC